MKRQGGATLKSKLFTKRKRKLLLESKMYFRKVIVFKDLFLKTYKADKSWGQHSSLLSPNCLRKEIENYNLKSISEK